MKFYNNEEMIYKTLRNKHTKKYVNLIRTKNFPLDSVIHTVDIPILLDKSVDIKSLSIFLHERNRRSIEDYEIVDVDVTMIDSEEYTDGKYIKVNWPDYQIYMEHKDWANVVMHTNDSSALVPLHIILEIDKTLE